MSMRIYILFLAAAFAVSHAGARPAMQPFPRECAWGEGVVEAAGLPVVRDDVRQCEIGASELPSAGASRVYAGEELGGCIYLAVRESALADRLTKAFALDVPAKRQGYALAAVEGRIAVVGHDAVGALYGAETLRQLMAEGGKVPAVRIRDWPDYAVRGQMFVWGGLNRYGEISTRKKSTLDVAAVKAGLDEMDEMPIDKRIYFSFYLRRAPYWFATARVRAALFAAREALESGASDGGLARIAAACETANRDYDAADSNAKELDRQRLHDIERFMPYGLTREEALKALDRAERVARAGVSSGADADSQRRAQCVAEAGATP